MSSSDDGERVELYVWFGIYLSILFVVAIVSKISNAREAKSRGSVAGEDLKQHFLAGKSTPPILLMLTTFSTIFSGYTVVGVPQEASTSGFLSIRWIGVVIAIAVSMLVIAPRLRPIGQLRGYTSPVDFVADRYRSEMLRLAIISSLYMGNLMYIVVQFVSLDNVVEGVTNGQIPGKDAVIFLAAVIMLLESLGGLKAVMLTDAIQSSLMLVSFIVVPAILTAYYGGFEGTLSTDNCTGGINTCGLDAMPTLFHYPTKSTATGFASYLGSFCSYAILPQMVQRIYTAGEARSIKIIVLLLPICAFLCMVPGMYMGILRATTFPQNEGTAFSVITTVLYDRGGFDKAIGTCLMCAGVAAIMSTADSAIIACSQLIAEDLVFKKGVDPEANHTRTLIASKISSLVTCVVAVLWSRDDQFDLGYCSTLQLGFQCLAFPIYVLGLYPNLVRWLTGGMYKSPSSRSMILGWMLGTAVFIILVIQSRGNGVEIWVQPGIWGTMANLAMIVFVESFGSPAWLDDFARDDYDLPPPAAASFECAKGEHGCAGLTDELLASYVEGIVGDPLVGAPSQCAVLAVVALIIVPSPWWLASGEHTHNDRSGGWPAWAIFYITCCAISAVIIIFLGLRWVPSDDAAAIDTSADEIAVMNPTAIGASAHGTTSMPKKACEGKKETELV